MRTATFRIQKLAVEGFKAFAAQQSLEIGDGHLFVFGRNGHGRSSVVEAIRWCLFGLADRPEAEVRNVFYGAAECRVELDLRGTGRDLEDAAPTAPRNGTLRSAYPQP